MSINMKNPVKNQMGFSPTFCFCKQTSLSLALLLLLSLFATYFSPAFLTLTALILSTTGLVFALSKKEAPMQEEGSNCNNPEEEGDRQKPPESESPPDQKESHFVPDEGAAAAVTKCPDILSRDLSTSSDDSETEWPAQIPACSDESFSDDDSLIEIALPDGHFVEPVLRPKPPEFSPESFFDEHGLMELFSEIYEEDNLIEIDISMGSIKCSTLEIEA